MDEEVPPENIDVVDTRPLEERIGDKNWKARQSAYDDLKKLVSEEGNTAIYSEYVSWLPKMTSDSNASALDSGLDAAVAFIDTASDGVCQPYYDKLFSNIVDKTFSGRASTLSKGKILMHKMMEVDDANACTAFLLTKLADKKPKVPPTSIDIIREGIEMFGVKAVPVKDVIKALPAVFNGSNSAARDSAMALIVEIYRWIRQAPLQGLLDNLRSAQKSDFERIVTEKADEFSANSPKPSLYLRKERPAPGSALVAEGKGGDVAATASVKSSGAAAAGEGGLDSREYVEEVDLVKKLKGTDFAALVANEKWSEQLRGLQIVIDAIGPVPKIKAGNDVHDLVAVIKGFLRQGHLQLQVNSLKILCLLADGLRTSFGSTVRPVMQQVVQKCKEKRLVPEVQAVLQMVFSHCLSYDCINEDVIEFVNNKKSPPHGKVGLMDVVAQTCTALPDKVASDSLKPLAAALVAETEDSDPKVREASIAALAAIGLLAKSRGRLAADALKVVMATENTLPKVFKRIQAIMDGGGQSALSATTGSSSLDALKPKPSASEPVAAAPVVKKPVGSTLSKTTSSLPSGASGAAKKPAGASSSAAPRKASAAASAVSAAADDDQAEDLVLSPEEAIAQLATMEIPKWVPETGLPGMDSAKWQEKVDALGAIERRLSELEQNGGSAQFSAALVKYLSATSSGFKINNINILKAMIQTCAAIVKAGSAGGGKFNRAAAWELLRHLGDKISDRKSKDAVQALLTALGEATSVGFVVKRMRAVLDKCISPLAHQYYLEWLKEAIAEFGCGAFPVPQIGSFCQAEMENKNASVRTAAVEVMGALFHQVGPRLAAIAFSDDMKPQLKALVEAEFAKVGHDPTAAAKAPRAVSVAGAATSDSGGSGGANSALGGIPRQDLCAMLDKNILAELNFVDGKTSWQRRKAAMEAIIASCERSAHFLEANKPTGEVVKALKPRMSDTQANLKPVAVSAIGHIVASLDTRTAGPKVLQSMAQAMMLGLGDNKKPMRDSTITALQHAVSGQLSEGEGATLAPADPGMLNAILPAAAESLVNVVGRLELLAWLLHHTDALKGDCTDLVNPLVLTLQDKNAAVRASGEQLLTTLMASSLCSKSTLDKATRDLPPATKRSIQAVVDRAMAAHGTAPPKPSAGTGASSVTSAAEVPPSPPRKVNSVVAVEAASVPSPPRAPAETCASPVVQNPAKQPVVTSNTPVRAAGPEYSAPTPATASSAQWLLKRNAAGKLRRAEEAQRLNWPQPPDAPSEMEIAALKVVWRPIVTPDLAFLLFPIVRPGSPVNQDVYMPAINELNSQLLCPFLLHHTEFLLRWICIVLCLKQESGPGLLRLLQLICDLFEAIHRDDPSHSALNDAEVSCILPHLVDRCGHRSERHQAMFRHAIALMGQMVSPSKMVHALLQGLKSHNKRSRGICLEELQRMVETEGAGVMSASSLKEVAALLDARDCDVAGRSACLDLVFAVFIALDKDAAKLKKMLGADISDGVLALVEERLERHHRKEVKEQASISAVAEQTPPTPSAVVLPPVTSAASAEKMAAQVEEVLRGTVNSDVWALTSEDASAVLSPKSEMRAHRMMLDSAMSSTPAAEDNSGEQVLSAEKYVEASNESTPAPAVVGSVERMTGNAGTPLVEPSSARRKSVLDGEDEEGAEGDIVGALPSEFRSPGPPVHRKSSRLSMSASKGVLGGDESPMVLELNGLYLDIESKVDALLGTAQAVSASDPLQEECKDYLKMLHSIVNGEWSAEKLPEDEAVLLLHTEPLVRRLCGCIARAFDLPVLDQQSSAPSNAIQGVDVSLLAISLSVLFSMVKRPEVAAKLSEDTLFEVFHECLHRICDVRITQMAQQSDALGLESKETAQQVARALNNIVLKLGLGGDTGTVLLAMLRVMFCCIPAAEVPHYADHRPLPTSSTKPASRLVIQILSEHGSSAAPYSESAVPLRPLLEGIHSFFTRHPTSTSNDTPFRTVKTILNEIVLVKGGESVLNALHETSIPRSAFIYLLTCRLGNVQPQPVESSGDLNAQIVAVIEDITSSRDKVGAIKELHRLKLANPQVDINHYLQKISAAFRRYVLNTLAKLDATSADDSENHAAHSNENREAAGSDLPEKSTPQKPTAEPVRTETPAAADYALARSTPMSHSHSTVPSHYNSSAHKSRLPTPSVHAHHHASAGNDSSAAAAGLRLEDPASEAMRILEGIKARPSQIAPLGDPSGASNTLARNYSLEYGGQGAGSSRAGVPPSGKHPEHATDNNSLSMTPGKQKRFAFNPETKRMEIVMVSNADASPGSSPTGLMAGDSSPFARRNDIIRNSLSSLTASLELPRSTLPSAATAANTQN